MLRKLRRGAQGSPPSTLREDQTERRCARRAPHRVRLWGRNNFTSTTPQEQLKEVQISTTANMNIQSTMWVGFLHHNSSGQGEPEGQAPASPAARGGAALAR